MKQKINSRWSQQRGNWDSKQNTYTNRHTIVLPDKELEMEILEKDGKAVLQFHGGPTGFESYYVSDLTREPDYTSRDFCICGGTINSWPRCLVDMREVQLFLAEYQRKRIQSHTK